MKTLNYIYGGIEEIKIELLPEKKENKIFGNGNEE